MRKTGFLFISAALLLVSSAAFAREGFGFLKKVVLVPRTIPPALRDASHDVQVIAVGDGSRETAEALTFRRRLESAIQAGGGTLAAGSAMTTVNVRLVRFHVNDKWEKKTEYVEKEVEKEVYDSDSGKTVKKKVKEKVPVEKRTRIIDGELSGSYQISAPAMQADSGSLDERFNEKYPEGKNAPTVVSIEERLLTNAIDKVASRIVPVTRPVNAIAPRGRLEGLIGLAERGQWAAYLSSVRTLPALSDLREESYREYALGLGTEAVAYQTSDKAEATRLLRESVEHYQKAMALNMKEDIFSERFNDMFTQADAPIERSTGSLRAYEHWSGTSGSQAARTAASTSAYTPSPSKPSAAVPTAADAPRPVSAQVASEGGRIVMYKGKPVRESDLPAAPSAPVTAAPQGGMNNDTVIELSKGGVSEDNIILAISGAKAATFDVSPQGLLMLTKSGVSQKVIAEMQKRAMR